MRIRALFALSLTAVMTAVAAAAATAPKPVGNPRAGKPLFVSYCGVCHRLAAAQTVGAIGPNLTGLRLSEATIVKAITNGGASVMTKAQIARYATQMVAYNGSLPPDVIQNIAAYVYLSAHQHPA